MAGNRNAVGNSLTGVSGSGAFVGATSPTLVTPALGTPSSGTLTNCTGLPVAGGGTGLASATAYAPLFGGTSSTGAFQSGTVGTSGQLAQSAGAGAIAGWTTATYPATASTANNVLTSDGTNWISKNTKTYFFACRTSNQSVSASTYTKIQFNIEDFDTGGMYDNATNFRYTPTIAGKYLLIVSVDIQALDNPSQIVASIYINGAGRAYSIVDNLIASGEKASIVSLIVDMNGSTDYAEGYVNQTSAGSKNVLGSRATTFFCGRLLELT